MESFTLDLFLQVVLWSPIVSPACPTRKGKEKRSNTCLTVSNTCLTPIHEAGKHVVLLNLLIRKLWGKGSQLRRFLLLLLILFGLRADKDKSQNVNWKLRLDIIVGIAEGLAYLHGGSETRIIHRDIKGSNVLLDENLAPKIADFGLARCFADDKSHLSTGIAGTL